MKFLSMRETVIIMTKLVDPRDELKFIEVDCGIYCPPCDREMDITYVVCKYCKSGYKALGRCLVCQATDECPCDCCMITDTDDTEEEEEEQGLNEVKL